MQKIITIIIILSCVLSCFKAAFAQDDELHQKKHKYIFSFDSRNSYIDGNNAGIFGMKFGLEHNHKHRFGIGIYSLKRSRPVFMETLITEIPNENITDTVDLYASLTYWSLFYEYVFYQTTRWEFSTPCMLGFGNAGLTYTWNNKNYTYKTAPILTLEPSITGQYKFFSWIGIGAGVGYRYVIYTNNNVKRRLNAPLYILKIKLFLGAFFKKDDK